jgi:hypothetical protein
MSIHAKPRKLAANGNTHSCPDVVRVFLTFGRFDRRCGQRYNAHLGSAEGEQIVTDALDVEFAACRTLKARGVTGRMETWRPGSAHPPMVIADIAEAAKWTIREDDRLGPTRVKYRSWAETGPSSRSSPPKVSSLIARPCDGTTETVEGVPASLDSLKRPPTPRVTRPLLLPYARDGLRFPRRRRGGGQLVADRTDLWPSRTRK